MGTVDDLAEAIWLAEFGRAFDRKPSVPWEEQSEGLQEKHRATAQAIIDAGFITSERTQFHPTDKTRDVLRRFRTKLSDDGMDEFFRVWEAEINNPDAPRMAGSVIAAAYMQNAARFGVFGAHCAGREPSLDLWMALARQNFEDAIKDCVEATERAEAADASGC